MTQKKRGRPLGKATLEKQRLEKMMQQAPAHLPRLTTEKKAELDENFKHNEKIRLQILEAFKQGPWTSDSHAYNMASLGDESMEGYEQKILDDDDSYNRQAKKYRAAAGAENKRKSESRQRKVIAINKVLIGKISNSNSYNIHRVAKIIHEQWISMMPAQRLASEDQSMSCRGDGGKPVSVRTITRWIEQHLSTFDKPRQKKILRT